MDRLTEQSRELVTVKLYDGDGVWWYDGLTWNGNPAKAQQMTRGRAEVLVAQSRRAIADRITVRPAAQLEIVDVEPAPAIEQPLTARQVARDLKQLIGATPALQAIRSREEDC